MFVNILNSYYHTLFLIHIDLANKLNTPLCIDKVQLSFRFCIDVLFRCILRASCQTSELLQNDPIGVIFLIAASIHRSEEINGLSRSPSVCIYERVFARTLKRERSMKDYSLFRELFRELSSCVL